MTAAEFKAKVERNLGGGVVDVELTDDQFTDALEDALAELNHWRPPRAWTTLAYADGQYRYALSHPSFRGVLDVSFYQDTPQSGAVCELFARTDAWPWALSTLEPGAELYGDMLQQQSYLGDAAIYSGRNAGWAYRNVAGTHYLMVSAQPGTKVSYQYSYHYTADDNATTGVGTIGPADLKWAVDYATARAKVVLGRALRKFGGGINLPDGGAEQLDGDTLSQDGRQEMADLVETIKRRRRSVGPVLG